MLQSENRRPDPVCVGVDNLDRLSRTDITQEVTSAVTSTALANGLPAESGQSALRQIQLPLQRSMHPIANPSLCAQRFSSARSRRIVSSIVALTSDRRGLLRNLAPRPALSNLRHLVFVRMHEIVVQMNLVFPFAESLRSFKKSTAACSNKCRASPSSQNSYPAGANPRTRTSHGSDSPCKTRVTRITENADR